MPVSVLATIRDEMPYDLELPRVGDKMVVTLPIFAVAAAVDPRIAWPIPCERKSRI